MLMGLLHCVHAPTWLTGALEEATDADTVARENIGGPNPGDFARTCLARAGKGGVRPLTFAEFLEVNVGAARWLAT